VLVTPEKELELLAQLKDGVVNFDEDAVRDTANEVVAIGMDAEKAVFEGLVPGMEEVGRLYEEQEYFVPEMLMCADALYAGLDILKPQMKKRDGAVRGTVVMGVVQGDVHDIGKNIVKMMFDVAGFEVHDLGRDVPLERFVEEQLRTELICSICFFSHGATTSRYILGLIISIEAIMSSMQMASAPALINSRASSVPAFSPTSR